MKTIVHKNNTRIPHDMGWIRIAASFRPDAESSRIHFGSMVNLDDAEIKPNEKYGFGFHPHRDMEIISLILNGTMDHRDKSGNNGLIKAPAVQAISSGTGIVHNEVNGDDTQLNMLQIWFLPNEKGLSPNYQTLEFTEASYINKLKEIVSPIPQDGKVSIAQNVRLSIGQFEENTVINYKLNGETHGAYIMVLEGSAHINGNTLSKRDAIGVSENPEITIQMIEENTKILVIEVNF